MDLRQLASNGTVSIPKKIREEMNLKTGDQVAFIRLDSGQYIIENPEKFKSIMLIDHKPGYSTERQQDSSDK
ncbi:AbrB/MazE/SpoVT family DNA-binding domain-containing protein [Paenibacillus jiagnxiensis]|uniref:AbrB/MazE/SpoVT family DNA-binding domain-containing protein n=1 Tax=Paenibacillus jiagnxiensis TaxID=3228926 RepID=UPI0033B50BB2